MEMIIFLFFVWRGYTSSVWADQMEIQGVSVPGRGPPASSLLFPAPHQPPPQWAALQRLQGSGLEREGGALGGLPSTLLPGPFGLLERVPSPEGEACLWSRRLQVHISLLSIIFAPLLLLGGNEDTGRRVLGAAVTVMRRPYLCPEGGSVCAEGRSLGTRQLGPMQLGHLGNGDSAVPPPRL